MVEGGAVFSTLRGQTPPQPWSSQLLKDGLLCSPPGGMLSGESESRREASEL